MIQIDEQTKHTLIPIVKEIKQLIEDHRKNNPDTLPIIAIAGCKGVGKSYFTQILIHLIEAQGHTVYRLKQNGFSSFKEVTSDALMHIEPRLKWLDLLHVLSQIAQRKNNVSIPYRDKSSYPFTIQHTIVDFSSIDLVVFDGSFSMSGIESYNFFSRASLGIFLATSENNIHQWRFERHSRKHPEQQKTKEQFLHDLAAEMAIYHDYVLPTKKNATFIIHKDENHRYTLIKNNPPTQN